MKNAALVVGLFWSGVSALTLANLEHGKLNVTARCVSSEAHHRNDLMESYCGHSIVEGIDKSIDAKGCKAMYTEQVQLALANKMLKDCNSLCLFDFEMPHLAAFRWIPAEQCWLKAESCGEAGEQDALVAHRRSLCEVPKGPCQPVAQLSDKVMSNYCARNELQGAEKFSTAAGCEEFYTHQVRRSLANRMFEDCGSWCLYDFDQPTIMYAWMANRKCWLQTGSPCGPRYAQQSAALRREKFCKDHTLSVNEAGCVPFSSQLSNTLMAHRCGDLKRYSVDISEDARACHFTDTPMVKKALANHMFSQCGAECIYDYDQPHARWYGWSAKSNCYDRSPAGCNQDVLGKSWALERKALACELATTTSTTTSTTSTTTSTTSTETSTTTVTTTTSTSTTSTSTTTSTTTSSVPCRPVHDGTGDLKSLCPGETPRARGCNYSDTAKVRKAFANFMFPYCGATCLFDFDNSSISFNWDPFDHCWRRHLEGPCGPPGERALVRKRRTLFC